MPAELYIFRKEIYATICLAGGVLYLGLLEFFPKSNFIIAFCIVAIFIVLVLTGIISQDELLDMLGEVQEGKTMKRFRAGSNGRGLPMRKRLSHISVTLTEKTN